jgi:integrase
MRRGMGTVYRRSGSRCLWMQYWENGHRHRQSTGKEKVAAARDVLNQKLIAIAGENLSSGAELTVTHLYQALVVDYEINGRKSVRTLKTRWNSHLKEFFGAMTAAQVTPREVTRYIKMRIAARAAVASINRELAALKRMYRLALQSDELGRIPHIRHLRECNTRKGFVRDEEYEALARETAAAGLWLRAIFELGYTYGWRKSELLSRRVRHADLIERTLRLDPGETKNGEPRLVEMTGKVFELLKECSAGKAADDFLFTRERDRRGRRIRTAGGRIVDFTDDWEMVCKAAGVAGLLFHDLRRSAVINMVRDGVSEKQAMTVSGHLTRSVFDRYHIVDRRQLRAAARKMEHGAQNRIREASQRELLFQDGEPDGDESAVGRKKPPESEHQTGHRTATAAGAIKAN